MKVTHLFCFTVAAAAMAAHATAVTIVFEDTEPGTGPTVAGNLTITNVADPILPGTAGELSGLNAQFTNVNTGTLTLPAGSGGAPFTYSIDYLIPTGSTLLDNPAASFFAQLNIDGVNIGTDGFIDIDGSGTATVPPGPPAPLDVWNTLTVSGTLPANATEAFGFLIINAGPQTFPLADDALLVDNFRLEVDVPPVPEPSAFALLGLASAGVLMRRRR